MTAEDIVREAVKRLVDRAQPLRVILFGSWARGDATKESDLDFIVILKEVKSRRATMSHLLDAVSTLPISMEVLVYSEDEVLEWGHLPGTALYEAMQEGNVLYEAA